MSGTGSHYAQGRAAVRFEATESTGDKALDAYRAGKTERWVVMLLAAAVFISDSAVTILEPSPRERAA